MNHAADVAPMPMRRDELLEIPARYRLLTRAARECFPSRDCQVGPSNATGGPLDRSLSRGRGTTRPL